MCMGAIAKAWAVGYVKKYRDSVTATGGKDPLPQIEVLKLLSAQQLGDSIVFGAQDLTNGRFVNVSFEALQFVAAIASFLPGPARVGGAAPVCMVAAGNLGAATGNWLREELNKHFNWQNGQAIKDAAENAWRNGIAAIDQALVAANKAKDQIIDLFSSFTGARAARATATTGHRLATARVRFTKPGRKRVKVRLTSLGRRLFAQRQRHSLKVTILVRDKLASGRIRIVVRRSATLRR